MPVSSVTAVSTMPTGAIASITTSASFIRQINAQAPAMAMPV